MADKFLQCSTIVLPLGDSDPDTVRDVLATAYDVVTENMYQVKNNPDARALIDYHLGSYVIASKYHFPVPKAGVHYALNSFLS